MKTLDFRPLTLIAALVASAATAPLAPADAIDDLAEAIRTEHELPALAAAVVHGDKIIATIAVGTRTLQGDEPVELDDRFHFGSCTKAITSSVVGSLVEAGEVEWSTTVLDVFPEWKDAIDPAYADVSLELLLTHRAGVMTFLQPGPKEAELTENLNGTPTEQRRAFAKRVLGEPPLFTPGEGFEYSNASYSIATAMIEQVAGKTWRELVRGRVFEPLGFERGGFGMPAAPEREDQPWGHMPSPSTGDLMQLPPRIPTLVPPIIEPAGDVHGSIRDFARFARAHLRGMRGEDVEGFLTSKTIQALHTPHREGYAFGWFERDFFGATAHAHNGSAGAFFAWIFIWPEENLAIVTASNAGTADEACRELAERLFNLHTTDDADVAR